MPTTNATTTASTTRALPDGLGSNLGSKLAYLTRVLKTPTIGRVWEDLAAAARDANWSHEEYLTAVLERQGADRESAGIMMRVRTAHFPQVKTQEDFNLDHLPSLRKDVLAHLFQTCHGDVRAQGRQRRAARTTRDRQDPPGDRAGHQGHPSRASRCCSTPPRTGSPASAEPTTPGRWNWN